MLSATFLCFEVPATDKTRDMSLASDLVNDERVPVAKPFITKLTVLSLIHRRHYEVVYLVVRL